MENKKRYKITLDQYVANLVTDMAKNKGQSKSVVIAKLILNAADKKPTSAISDDQFHQMSDILQDINNQLSALRIEISTNKLITAGDIEDNLITEEDIAEVNRNYYDSEFDKLEKKIRDFDKELTKLVSHQR